MASLALLGLFAASVHGATYPLAEDWSGSSFFQNWIYNNTYDSLTNGDAIYTNYSYASQHGMAVLQNGQAVIAVDSQQTVPYNYKRNTMKMSSVNQFGVGSVFVMDASHIPYGCSVWPSFWTQGANWPNDGEMDIMEGVNLQTGNLMALHTAANSGCVATASNLQTGSIESGQTTCSTTASSTGGCVIADGNQDSYGAAFAQSGGGVFAAELATTGVHMWFFPRASIPSALSSNASTIDTSTWGTPTANFTQPAGGCNIGNTFGFQTIILDITLCGDFAGAPAIYNATCEATRPGLCYTANVIGNGSNYADAYFSINYVRAYSSNMTMLASTATSSGGSTPSGAASAITTGAQAAVTGATTTTSAKSSASSLIFSLPMAIAGIVVVGGLTQLYL